MEKEIIETPKISDDLKLLVERAEKIYLENFDSDVWFGRCIFLSWYCERGTCNFCFRSTIKHKIMHARDARRSLASIAAEALIIKACKWRIEFLTGGYGIYEFNELISFCRLISQILEEKIWINLGTLSTEELRNLKPYVEGIVSSLETLNPELHNKVCPDKPLQPYLEMMENAKKLGFKQSITLVIGIAEKKEDYNYVKEIIKKYSLERITIYALRPVSGTPYKEGPKTEEILWWLAKIRCDFPEIEIIAGTAIYRIQEINLLLVAGANAFTKLPAIELFNTAKGIEIEHQAKKAGRNLISRFTSNDLSEEFDFDAKINSLDLTANEKNKIRDKLQQYLERFDRNRISIH